MKARESVYIPAPVEVEDEVNYFTVLVIVELLLFINDFLFINVLLLLVYVVPNPLELP